TKAALRFLLAASDSSTVASHQECDSRGLLSMKRVSSGPVLTTIFVDYDNIYLSLKRKNEDAAKRFAKDSAVWLQAIASGELITPTSPYQPVTERRIAMNR